MRLSKVCTLIPTYFFNKCVQKFGSCFDYSPNKKNSKLHKWSMCLTKVCTLIPTYFFNK